MMSTTIELTEETLDNIVIDELKYYYDTLSQVSDDWYSKPEDKKADTLCSEAIITVLRHYLTYEEHREWLLTLEKTQK